MRQWRMVRGVHLPSRGVACLVVALSLLPAQGSFAAKVVPAAEGYAHARDQYFELKGSDAKKQFRHHWVNVIAAFGRVARAHPKSPEAPKAWFTMGELWRGLYDISRRPADLEQALLAYEHVGDDYPKSSLADDALWHRASIYHRRGDNVAAARDARALLARYPKGDMRGEAKVLAKQLAAVVVPAPGPAPSVASTGRGSRQRKVVGAADGKRHTVQRVAHWNNGTYTRVALYVDGGVRARTGWVPAGDGPDGLGRLYVDLSVTSIGKDVVRRTKVDDERVSAIRVAQFSPDVVRVVLELRKSVTHRVLSMESPGRIILDVFQDGATPPTPPQDTSVKIQRHVVLDPGHGGKDTGAIGVKGLQEKRVVLAIAKEVAKRLERAGVKATLTRSGDTYVPLEERAALANRLNADAFVSIHANSHEKKSARGIETYYLNVTDDRYSIRLAAVENKTSEDSVSDLQLILADLSTKASTPRALALAKAVQKKMVGRARKLNPKVRDLGVKGSLFYVLLGARMPAVLLETSFISNRVEGRLLGQKSYRDDLAGAIADALVAQVNIEESAVDP